MKAGIKKIIETQKNRHKIITATKAVTVQQELKNIIKEATENNKINWKVVYRLLYESEMDFFSGSTSRKSSDAYTKGQVVFHARLDCVRVYGDRNYRNGFVVYRFIEISL